MAVQHIGHTLSGIAGGFVAVLVVLDGADLDRVTAAGSIASERLVDALFRTCPKMGKNVISKCSKILVIRQNI